jgi:hypothetical protein
MSEIKQPQDHKSKVAKFSFKDADGVEHSLPLASEGAANIPGKLTRDAVMSEDDAAELRLGFALLEACGADQSDIDAVYSLSTEKMLETLGAWMTHGDGEGATVPQS